MSTVLAPAKLNLKKDEKLEVTWPDGRVSVYPIRYLRKHCPCAECKAFREEQAKKPATRLTVLGKTSEAPLAAKGAQLVGGYAIQIDWSDDHGAGIYSWQYLREIDPAGNE